MAQLIVRLKGKEVARHEIMRVTTRIGRDAGNELTIDNPGISRIHALILFEDPHFVLIDQDSANGVFIGGERIAMHRLTDGDRVEIGKFEIEFTTAFGNDDLGGGMLLEEPDLPNPVSTLVLPLVRPEDIED